MFTGLIREIAEVKSYKNNILSIKSKHKAKLGDSIAVNGVCLTVIKVNPDGFDLELADETRSIIDKSKISGKVHIEPAMMMGSRFEGHIVQGHIDCIGDIVSITNNGNSIDFYISIPQKYIKFVIDKGSIAIDGISLTVNEVLREKNQFRLTIIPHTLKNTLFTNYSIKSRVNIETDMFARYVYGMFSKKDNTNETTWSEIDSVMATW